jgi:hypothetical protein
MLIFIIWDGFISAISKAIIQNYKNDDKVEKVENNSKRGK